MDRDTAAPWPPEPARPLWVATQEEYGAGGVAAQAALRSAADQTVAYWAARQRPFRVAAVTLTVFTRDNHPYTLASITSQPEGA